MLALALVFNDLKGLALIGQWLLPSRPTERDISPHSGEWRGLDLQIHRLVVALIRELLGLLDEFEDEARGAEVRRLLQRASARVRSDWSDLLRIATGKGDATSGKFAKVLVQVRNNVAFHYAQPKSLLTGYRAHFFKAPRNPANAHAYCSLGQNMERTRFYFADAAVEGALASMQESMGPGTTFLRSLSRARDATNHTLAFLLEEYTRPARLPGAPRVET